MIQTTRSVFANHFLVVIQFVHSREERESFPLPIFILHQPDKSWSPTNIGLDDKERPTPLTLPLKSAAVTLGACRALLSSILIF